MTTDTPTPTPPGPPSGRLWRIADVAAYTTLCENTLRQMLRDDPTLPAPIVTQGKVRLWSAPQWYRWADERAGLTTPPVDATMAVEVEDLGFGA